MCKCKSAFACECLVEPKLDLSKPLMMSNGKQVIAGSLFEGSIYVFYIEDHGKVYSHVFNHQGKSTSSSKNELRLINVPEERYAYVNVYKNDVRGPYTKRVDADMHCAEDRIGCIKVKVEARFDD